MNRTTLDRAPWTQSLPRSPLPVCPPSDPQPPSPRRHEFTHIRRELTPDNVCILAFDRPHSSANVFDRITLEELHAHVTFLEHNPDVRGLVISSAKPDVFLAGADLHAISQFMDDRAATAPELVELIYFGQAVIDRLARLPLLKVAAIHGACLGGGFELALACDLRLASPERPTKIGLPEVQLGLVPAWGGLTRLPRLIGLPQALDLILGAKTLAAKPALKRGLVDELVPRECLVDVACQRLTASHPASVRRRRPLGLRNNRLTAGLLALILRRKLRRKTRGHYPAVLKALEVATLGVTRSIGQSLALEREAILGLAQGDVCRHLIRIFLLQERAKKLKRSPRSSESTGEGMETRIRRCAVLGAGVMGAGIAQWLSARGLSVVLRDIDPPQVAKGVARIAALYAEGRKRHTFTPLEMRQGLDRLFPAGAEVPLRNSDIIIEAAVEELALKQSIFRDLAGRTNPDTILATNTSALSVTEIAAATQTPDRVIGIHFFNPVHRMQLVEVCVAKQTAPEVAERTVRFVQQIGKLPLIVQDSPGFLVNRILMPYLLEAGVLFELGARIRDIDEAMLEFGMPMGPLRLMDEVGVDIARRVGEGLASHFQSRLAFPPLLEKMVQVDLLGRKSGRGFYLYHGRQPIVHRELSLYQTNDVAAALTRPQLQERMVLLMVNEAARALEEGVVCAPEDVDFGMVMGTGFAPFRGGPLRYADAMGVGEIVLRMRSLADTNGSRFEPCDLLQSLAKTGKRFYAR